MQDFYINSTKKFSVQILYNGSAPNITTHTVTLILKSAMSDPDSAAVVNKNADVLTYGAIGKAIFTLNPADLDIIPKRYHYEIFWTISDTEIYPLEIGQVTVKDRVKD